MSGLKVLVIGYMHLRNDKRVFRTVQALSKKGEVIYQYWTEKEELPLRRITSDTSP